MRELRREIFEALFFVPFFVCPTLNLIALNLITLTPIAPLLSEQLLTVRREVMLIERNYREHLYLRVFNDLY